MMKKHAIVLIILLLNAMIFTTYLVAWLGFGQFSEDTFLVYIILSVSFIMPITLIGMFILLSKNFDANKKVAWVIYILLTSFIGSIHFYLKYKNEIRKIAEQTKKEMKNGPSSLKEFNS